MIKKYLEIDSFSKKILIALLIYFIVMLIIFLPSYIKSRYEKLYIIDNNYRIKYTNGRWSKNDLDLTERKYTIYENDEFKGKYETLLSTNIFLFEEGKRVEHTGSIFGYSGTLKFEFYGVENNQKMEESDKYAIETALNELGVTPTYDLSFFQKEVIDIDKDGTNESIYCISNYYSTTATGNRFSMIFINDGDDVSIIDSYVVESEFINTENILVLLNVFDIRKDGKFELLYNRQKPMGSSDNNCLILYNLAKKKVINNFCGKD